jgi:1-acyl-sn-glycerol-3-phosphate acyltransferase
MIYELTRPLAKLGLSVYFRKVYFFGSHLIPVDKPVLLATNHPTAVIEPCIMAAWLSRSLSFLARGDLFVNSRFFRLIYRFYHIVPVFRVVDTGYSNVNRNYETFNFCYDALAQKKAIMILAEGKTIHEKRLRPLRKGTARIIFGSYEKYGDLDVQIIPVGINYSNSNKFRGHAYFDFGEPISASQYFSLYNQDQNKAISKLTRDLHEKLRERVIHVENPEDDQVAELLLEYTRNEFTESFVPVTIKDNSLLVKQIEVINTLNQLLRPSKDEFCTALENYRKALEEAEITDKGLLHSERITFSKRMLCLIGNLPSLTGKILNYAPLALGDYLGNRLAPAIEFRASIAGISGSIAWLLYIILIVIALWIGISARMTALSLLIPLLGWFHLFHKEQCAKWIQSHNAHKLSDDKREMLQKFRQRWKDLLHSNA